MNLYYKTRTIETLNIETHVKNAQNGDIASLALLYESYNKAMLNTCVRIVKDLHSAEDILQDAFIKAFENIHRLRDTKTFGGWLKRIVINEALKQNKKNFLWVEVSEEEERLLQEEPELDWWQDYELKDLLTFIDNLPNGCRLVFNLFAIEDLSHKEIAEKLNISESTSKSQYSRAKRLLRKMVTPKKKRNG